MITRTTPAPLWKPAEEPGEAAAARSFSLAAALAAHQAWLDGRPDGAPLRLRRLTLSGRKASGAKLAKASLQYVSWLEADLAEADLSEAVLEEVDLRRAALSGAEAAEMRRWWDELVIDFFDNAPFLKEHSMRRYEIYSTEPRFDIRTVGFDG